MPTVIIACRVLQSLLQELAPAEVAQNAVFMDYGLHRQPAKMTRELQEKIKGFHHHSTRGRDTFRTFYFIASYAIRNLTRTIFKPQFHSH